jgi:putative hemolysin
MNDAHPADGNEGLLSALFRKLGTRGKRDDDVTGEEIKDMVNEGHEHGVLNENEAEMINNIFEFGEKQAQDVMTHRKSIAAIDSTATVQEAFDFIMNESYSRYPVIDGDIDNIMGILHIRDLLKVYVDEQKRCKQLSEIKDQVLFDAYYIPETRNISLLFKEMQSKKVHIAVVVDEYGQTAGIVTMEDILEEIVGNIQDEYDEEKPIVEKVSDSEFIVNALASIYDVNEYLPHDLPEDGDYDTLAGLLGEQFGKIPEVGEQQEIYGYIFTILKKTEQNIESVKLELLISEDDAVNLD